MSDGRPRTPAVGAQPFSRGKFVATLEEMGEEQVRRAVVVSGWDAQRISLAERWLSARSASRSEASQRESSQTARSAKNAAWAAAIAAIIASVVAVIAVALPR